MKLGIDVDGVVADFVTGYTDLIRQKFGIRLPPRSDSYPDVWDFELAGGVTKAQRSELLEHIKSTEFFGALYPENRRTFDALQRLSEATYHHDVYFITQRSGARAKWLTEKWLGWHGFVKPPTVLIVNGAEGKGLIAKALGLDVFVDDKPENLMAVLRATEGLRAYLIDKPYNTNYADGYYNLDTDVMSHWSRVPDLNDVLDLELTPKALLQEAA